MNTSFHKGHFSTVEATDDPHAVGDEPIPAHYYYDPEWYELERRAVFMRSWLNIGHVCEVPESGSFVRREIEFAKASLLIVRGKDGEVRVMHNACTHRGTQLVSDVSGRQSKFSCPYHMWTFGSEGDLLSAPDFERFNLSKADCKLREVASEVCGGLIFINFEPQQSLREYLGPLAEKLEQLPVARATHFHEYAYDINANWKLTYDNFQENYHLRFIHPRSVGPGVGAENPFGYPASYSLVGKHRTQTIWTNPDARPNPVMLQAFMRGAARLGREGLLNHPLGREYFALFPNFFLLGNPGNHFLHTVYPMGPERSRGTIRLYWVGEDENASTRYAREFTMATTRDVHSEDVGVVEAGQRGLSSGALSHIHFQEKEILCRHLIKVVEETVDAYRNEMQTA